MRTVHQVSRITGVSIRALHHYDAIGLLPATEVTEAGYRLYDDAALERLQSILLFKELEFPLNDIKQILDSPGFDKNKALEQQIHLLEMRKAHLQNLIDLARGMKMMGVNTMNFDVFDTRKIDEYAKQAKESWGTTPAYKEFQQKDAGRTTADQQAMAAAMMQLFAEFGEMKAMSPESDGAMAQARKLQQFITENFYHCSDEILCCLADMYAGGGDFTKNIDQACGEGTAALACQAIHAMVNAKENR